MTTLYVGDVHARPEDLGDCQNLLNLVLESAQKHQVSRIIFLGDQHHTHAIIHLDVLAFWRHNVQRLTAAGFSVVLMVGNHDMSGDSSSGSHALMAYEGMDKVVVVSEPQSAIFAKHTYLPYMADHKKFIATCKSLGDVIVCHQEFNGCEYENGFYSSTGVDPEAIPQNLVISGHIHTPQRFGKVWYLGSPRWLTASDANQERYIYVVDHALDGSIKPGLHGTEQVVRISTGDACQRIYQVEDHFETPFLGTVDPRHRYIVDIVGPQAWIEDRRPMWLGKARIRTHRTDQQIIRLKESEGIERALVTFAKEFIPPHGTSAEVLMGMVTSRLLEAV